MKYNFSSSPWGFRFLSLDAYCRAMQSLGLTHCCFLTGGFGEFPLAFGGGKAKAPEYLATLQRYGISVLETAMTLDRTKEDLPLIAALGAKYLRICEVWENTPEERQRMAQRLRELGKQAGDCGMTVIVENHAGLTGASQDCALFFEAVNSPHVKLNFDGANFLHFLGEDPLQALKNTREFLGFFHLKNVSSSIKDQGDFCRLAEGVIDYQPILEELRKTRYDGCLCLEYEHPEDIVQGTADDLSTLKQWLKD